MTVYNYENITYHVTGISTINDPTITAQEGLLIYLQINSKAPDSEIEHSRLTIFLDKRDLAHIVKTTDYARKNYWKRFRLPKMKRQTSATTLPLTGEA